MSLWQAHCIWFREKQQTLQPRQEPFAFVQPAEHTNPGCTILQGRQQQVEVGMGGSTIICPARGTGAFAVQELSR